MKRLLFAGIIFQFIPAFAQTKAGKIDTVKNAVYYSCLNERCGAATAGALGSSKEHNGKQLTKKGKKIICIHTAGKRTIHRSSKETMKAGHTGNNK